LRHASWWKAELLSDMGRVGESAPYWDRAVQLNTNPRDTAFLRHKRAWAWVYSGEHAKALEEINDLEKLGRFDDFKLQDLALLCALSAAKIAEGKAPPSPSGAPLPAGKMAKPYADRAMELLCKGVEAGYDDLAALKNHPDWAVLRPRS